MKNDLSKVHGGGNVLTIEAPSIKNIVDKKL